MFPEFLGDPLDAALPVLGRYVGVDTLVAQVLDVGPQERLGLLDVVEGRGDVLVEIVQTLGVEGIQPEGYTMRGNEIVKLITVGMVMGYLNNEEKNDNNNDDYDEVKVEPAL